MKRLAIPTLMILLVLSLAAGSVLAAPLSQSDAGQVYIVQAGDTLSKIAAATYGDPLAYATIVTATNAAADSDAAYARIDNPDVIEVGQQLWLPAAFSLPAAASQSVYAGRYGAMLPAADSQGRNTVLELSTDGKLMLVTDYLKEAVAPIVELGAWQDNPDGSIQATITGDADGAVYDAPIAFTFQLEGTTLQAIEWDQNTWGSAGLTLERLAQPEAARFYGLYTASLPAASGPGRDLILTLTLDWAAFLFADYNNEEAPIVEVGRWAYNADGAITVTLTGRVDGTLYEAPEVLTFELTGDQLAATEWDKTIWGKEGLTMTKTNVWPAGSGQQQPAVMPEQLAGAWKWQQTLYNNDEVVTAADPERYIIEFLPAGRLAGLADCNRMMGSYVITGSQISIGPLASTMMACPDMETANKFSAELEQAVTYILEPGKLFLDLPMDAGTMAFAR